MSSSDDEDGPSASDRAFFAQARGVGFLTSLALPEVRTWENPRKRKRNGEDAALASAEQSHQQRQARKGEKAPADEQLRLPIKQGRRVTAVAPAAARASSAADADADADADLDAGLSNKARKRRRQEMRGQLQQQQQQPTDTVPRTNGGDDDELVVLSDDEIDGASMPGSTAADFVVTQKSVEQYKLIIAAHASSILEDPENKIGELRHLRELCNCKDAAVAVAVSKLAIVSLVTIFKDIAPGYRIRALSDEEKSAPLTKEVKHVRSFEQGLLANYQAFLQHIYKRIRVTLERGGNRSVFLVAARALCTLLQELPHFNFRGNIVAAIVPLMTEVTHPEVATVCCQTIRQIFNGDPNFDISLEIVLEMSRVIKARNYKVSEEMINCYLSLRLRESLTRRAYEDASAKEAAIRASKKRPSFHQSRAVKKETKAAKELSKELRELDAAANERQLSHRQSDILKSVFATYFRVVKNATQSPLMPAVLEGLGKFAHLIDASFLGDVLAALNNLVSDTTIGTRVKLHCVKTGCMILAGPGAHLNIDVKTFHDSLYSEMLNVPGNDGNIHLALECLDRMLVRRKEISVERVAAFIKRLGSIVCQLEPHQAVSALATIRSILQKYPRCTMLLEPDELSVGVYRPDVAEPEHSNAFAAQLWETGVLKAHFHPFVAMHAHHVAEGAPSTGAGALPPVHSRTPPHMLFSVCDYRRDGFTLNPPMKPPPTRRGTPRIVPNPVLTAPGPPPATPVDFRALFAPREIDDLEAQISRAEAAQAALAASAARWHARTERIAGAARAFHAAKQRRNRPKSGAKLPVGMPKKAKSGTSGKQKLAK